MLTLNDGRSELWQWDTGRTLAVDADCSQVHFSNKVFGRSIDVDVVDSTAIIPDILLQADKDLNVWAFAGTAENGYTKISKTFKINRRNKPADYVFTPPEQTSLEEIKEKIDYLESIQDPDAIKNAVNDYIEQNPVEAPVQSVNGQTGEVELTAEDVGAISQDDLQEATNEALAQAKASGEFDGADGADGGYYSPSITQPDENTMRVAFTPSDSSMPEVASRDVTLPAGAGGKSAYQYAVEGGYTGTEAEFAAKLATEKFANPNALTFTGAVTGAYDGSAPLSVDIPSGGGSGGGSGATWTKFLNMTIEEDITTLLINEDDSGNAFAFDEIRVFACFVGTSANTSESYVEFKSVVEGGNLTAPVNILYAKRVSGSVASTVFTEVGTLPSGDTIVRVQASSGSGTISGNNSNVTGTKKLAGVRFWANGNEYIGAGTQIVAYGMNRS